MRKQVGSAFEVLVNDVARQLRGIDGEEHQIGATRESPVGDVSHLAQVRAVDETVGVERLRRVAARLRRRGGLVRRGQVVNRMATVSVSSKMSSTGGTMVEEVRK